MGKLYRRDVLKALARGDVIRVEYRNHPPAPPRRIYTLRGMRLAEETVKNLIEDCLIRPNKDGLFDDGPPQSYRLWRASEGGA